MAHSSGTSSKTETEQSKSNEYNAIYFDSDEETEEQGNIKGLFIPIMKTAHSASLQFRPGIGISPTLATVDKLCLRSEKHFGLGIF